MQNEKLYTAAYSCLVKCMLFYKLRAASLATINLNTVALQKHPPRTMVMVSGYSEVGKTTLTRALIEAERRYCGSDSEVVSGLAQIIPQRELLATLLDLRSVGVAHFTPDQRAEAISVFEGAYVDFGVQCGKHDREVRTAWEEKCQREAAAAKAGVEAACGTCRPVRTEGEEGSPPLNQARFLDSQHGRLAKASLLPRSSQVRSRW